MRKDIFFWETSTSEILLINHVLIVMIHSTVLTVAALMCGTWLLPALLFISKEDSSLQKKTI